MGRHQFICKRSFAGSGERVGHHRDEPRWSEELFGISRLALPLVLELVLDLILNIILSVILSILFAIILGISSVSPTSSSFASSRILTTASSVLRGGRAELQQLDLHWLLAELLEVFDASMESESSIGSSSLASASTFSSADPFAVLAYPVRRVPPSLH